MRALACLLLLLAAGCSGGPDADTLRRDVEARVARALPSGTVEITELKRRGSQSDARAPEGETRRILYYDVSLRLARDFDFGGWDSPGVAGVISALGSGPKGIAGIAAGGNKAGDVIRAHGTALYRQEGAGWIAASPGGYEPSTAPAYATNAPPGNVNALLEAVQRIVESVPKETAPARLAILEEELTTAHAAIRSRLARASEGYGIAAGPEHGQYLRFARALSDGKGPRIVPLVTLGGEENLKLLRDGKVPLALAQGDVALNAYEGKGRFVRDGPNPELRAIGSLYPEPLHVLVRADGALASFADLAGKRVAIGRQGSASRTTTLRVLAAHGLKAQDVVAVELGLGDALVGLRQGTVDAVIQVIGMPADSLRDALAEVPIRLIPLSDPAVRALVGAGMGYFSFRIPAGTYPAQAEGVRTIATAAILLAGPDLSDNEVGAITRFLFEKGRDFGTRGSAQGTQVSTATARHGLTVPMHLSAAKALEAPGAR
jgi:TRAP transporter TAXI family solute receptor